jgi:hypothetical protein
MLFKLRCEYELLVLPMFRTTDVPHVKQKDAERSHAAMLTFI